MYLYKKYSVSLKSGYKIISLEKVTRHKFVKLASGSTKTHFAQTVSATFLSLR